MNYITFDPGNQICPQFFSFSKFYCAITNIYLAMFMKPVFKTPPFPNQFICPCTMKCVCLYLYSYLYQYVYLYLYLYILQLKISLRCPSCMIHLVVPNPTCQYQVSRGEGLRQQQSHFTSTDFRRRASSERRRRRGRRKKEQKLDCRSTTTTLHFTKLERG